MINIFAGTNTTDDIIAIMKHLILFRPIKDGLSIKYFEEMFASYVGTSSAISFASGRMALYAILEALDIGEGDEVIIPAFTCVVVPNAILYRKAKPIYVDIECNTFNIDVSQLDQFITKRTKAIIAQHTFGTVCNIEEIKRIAELKNIIVIEDCAHALGAKHKNNKIGSLTHVAYFSIDHTKVISTSTGGMVTTNDENIARKIKDIQQQSEFLGTFKIIRICITIIFEAFFYHPAIYKFGKYILFLYSRMKIPMYFRDELQVSIPNSYPYPARLSNVQAIIGINQLNKIEIQIEHRRKIAQSYDSILNLYHNLIEDTNNKNIFLYYSFLVQNKSKMINFFYPEVQLNDWFHSIAHGRMNELEKIGYHNGSCPNGEFISKHIVNLPTHPKVNNITNILFKLKLLASKIRSCEQINGTTIKVIFNNDI